MRATMATMARRDNGLPADSWQPLADVESALTDHVLDALADEGIAAYADRVSSHDSLHGGGAALGVGRTVAPTDQVHVDRSRRSDARALMDRLLPELRAEAAASSDEEWSRLVAGWTAAPDARGDHDDPDGAEPDRSADAAAPGRDDEWADVRPERSGPPAELRSDGEDHFVPPEPPPLPTADTPTRLAWTAVIAGPLYLLLATLFDWQADGLVGLLAVAAFVGGFVTLVARMKDRAPLDGSGDDGAVV